MRALEASELIGGAKEIIFSKTGVLTKGEDMKVKLFWTEGRFIDNESKNILLKEDFVSSKDLMINNILANTSDAEITESITAEYKPYGNAIDCALLEFL